MKLLLTNDDGVNAKGLSCLYQQLSQYFDDITVVAPDRNCSACSHALTLINPLRVEQTANGFFGVNGTPADCVNLALDQLLQQKPDWVISGINHGPNLGQDVIYSGTVAAAIEGRLKGVASMAVSLTGADYVHYDTAAKVVSALIKQHQQQTLTVGQVLNVNVPLVPWSELKGIKVTKLGERERPEPMSKTQDPWGRPIYWYGRLGQVSESGPETDFHAVAAGYASVTPLTIDMTHYQSMSNLTQWINEVKLS